MPGTARQIIDPAIVMAGLTQILTIKSNPGRVVGFPAGFCAGAKNWNLAKILDRLCGLH
jgi:hypothetical protein